MGAGYADPEWEWPTKPLFKRLVSDSYIRNVMNQMKAARHTREFGIETFALEGHCYAPLWGSKKAAPLGCGCFTFSMATSADDAGPPSRRNPWCWKLSIPGVNISPVADKYEF
jgi:hypothetical protein